MKTPWNCHNAMTGETTCHGTTPDDWQLKRSFSEGVQSAHEKNEAWFVFNVLLQITVQPAVGPDDYIFRWKWVAHCCDESRQKATQIWNDTGMRETNPCVDAWLIFTDFALLLHARNSITDNTPFCTFSTQHQRLQLQCTSVSSSSTLSIIEFFQLHPWSAVCWDSPVFCKSLTSHFTSLLQDSGIFPGCRVQCRDLGNSNCLIWLFQLNTQNAVKIYTESLVTIHNRLLNLTVPARH